MKRARNDYNKQNLGFENYEPAFKKRKEDASVITKPGIINKYGQTHGINLNGEVKFHSWCQSILARNLEVIEIVQNFKSWFFATDGKKNNLLVDDKENIDPVVNLQISTFKRFGNEEVQSHIDAYQYALKVIKFYINEDKKINTENKFYLQILLAKLSYRSGKIGSCIVHYTHARTILFHAFYSKNAEDNWSKENHTSKIETKINKKLIRYNLKIAKGTSNKNSQRMDIESPENILASKTYAQESIKFEAGLDMVGFLGLLNAPQAPEFSKQILLLHALDSINHNKFSIYLLRNNTESGVKGFYNRKNKVVIYSKIDKEKIDSTKVDENTLLHELMHKALDRVFDNNARPYFEDDLEAQKAYHECMKAVLINCIEAVIPFEELSQFPCNKKCCFYFGNKCYQSKIKFPYTWSLNMTFDQLVKNCFQDRQLLTLAAIRSKKGQSMLTPYADSLLRKLQILFSGNSYKINVLDQEFITNMTHGFLSPEAQNSKLIQPLMEFIKNFVLPEMENFIADHPCRNQIA